MRILKTLKLQFLNEKTANSLNYIFCTKNCKHSGLQCLDGKITNSLNYNFCMKNYKSCQLQFFDGKIVNPLMTHNYSNCITLPRSKLLQWIILKLFISIYISTLTLFSHYPIQDFDEYILFFQHILPSSKVIHFIGLIVNFTFKYND